MLLTSLRDINDDGFCTDNANSVSSCDGSCFPAQLINWGWHFFQTEFPEQNLTKKLPSDGTFMWPLRHSLSGGRDLYAAQFHPFLQNSSFTTSSTWHIKLLSFQKKFPKGTVSSSGPFVPNFCKSKPKFAQICLSSGDFAVFQMESDGSDLRPMLKNFQSVFKNFCHDWLQTMPSFFEAKFFLKKFLSFCSSD